jgi:adenosine deaminase
MLQHPFRKLDELGVKITINSDDPSIFGISLCDEYTTIAREFGYTINDLIRFAKNSIQASFATNKMKTKYLQEIKNWEETYLTAI